jgi:hypothetical protein
VGRSLWREDHSVVYNCCWHLAAQLFSGPSPVRLMTIFYCLTFETSLFVRTLAPIAVLMTSRYGPRRKTSHCFTSITSVGICLFAKVLFSNVCLYPLIKNMLSNSGCCFLVCFAVTGLRRPAILTEGIRRSQESLKSNTRVTFTSWHLPLYHLQSHHLCSWNVVNMKYDWSSNKTTNHLRIFL